MQTLNSLYFELRFVSLHRKFATSNFVITNNQRSSLIFREESNEICLESSLIFRSKFARTKGEFRRISFAFLLHNTVSEAHILGRIYTSLAFKGLIINHQIFLFAYLHAIGLNASCDRI